MWIKTIQCDHFRNLSHEPLELTEGIHWFHGNNGQGKTNLLEAIYFALTSKSFRTHKMSDLLCNQEKDFSIATHLIKGNQELPLRVKYTKGKVQRQLGTKTMSAFDYFQLGSVMAFTVRSKKLIDGTPSERRLFADRMLAYFDPQHVYDLGSYRKILGQVKRILRTSKDLNYYRSFKRNLATLAKRITAKRQQFFYRYQRTCTPYLCFFCAEK